MVIHLFKNQRRHLLKIYSTTHMVQYIMKKEKNTFFFLIELLQTLIFYTNFYRSAYRFILKKY